MGWEENKERLEPYMTEDEFYSLTNYGREIAVYWTTWLPKMCQAREEEHGRGSLYRRIKELGRELTHQAGELQAQGLNESQWNEILREQFQYEPEPETMEEEEEEETETVKLAQEYWRIKMELLQMRYDIDALMDETD